MHGRQGTKEEGGGGRCGGTKMQRKKRSGTPCQTRGKLKGGGGAVERWACSRTATGRDRKYGWVIGILGQRRSTPKWANDLMWQSEMLGRIQGTPRWADEPVWWLWQGLGNMHNNMLQSLGLEQSLTKAWKNHPIIRLHYSPQETG